MKKIIKKSINFLSSTRIAAILISAIIISSIIGTFTKSYSVFISWWYISLLLLMVISLVVCTSKRFSYLFKNKASSKANLKKKTSIKISVTPDDQLLLQIKEILKIKKFKIKEFNNALIAEKHSINRWGAFIIHLGIIVMALGIISRMIPGWYMQEYVWLAENEEFTIPQTNYSLKNNQFHVEHYEDGSPKLYQTDLQLLNLNTDEVIKEYLVQVNKALKFKKFSILQSDFQKIISEFNIKIIDKNTGKTLGNITLDPLNLNKKIPLVKPYELIINDYFPNLTLNMDNQPISKSLFPQNPAIVFQIKNNQTNSLSTKQWFILRNFTDPSLGQETNFKVELYSFKDDFVSGLIIHKDLGKPFVFSGLFITVLGLFIALYFQHKKLWITYTINEIIIEARTNRNIEGLHFDIQSIIENIHKEINKNEQRAYSIF